MLRTLDIDFRSTACFTRLPMHQPHVYRLIFGCSQRHVESTRRIARNFTNMVKMLVLESWFSIGRIIWHSFAI